jgi:hypothetical protein
LGGTGVLETTFVPVIGRIVFTFLVEISSRKGGGKLTTERNNHQKLQELTVWKRSYVELGVV